MYSLTKVFPQTKGRQRKAGGGPWSLAPFHKHIQIMEKKQALYFHTCTLLPGQFSSIAQACPILCNPMNCSMPGFPVHCQLPELAQTHVCWVSDAIHPSYPLSSPSPTAFNLSQHQGLFQWVSSLHQGAKVLAFQLHHQSFQWIFRTYFL